MSTENDTFPTSISNGIPQLSGNVLSRNTIDPTGTPEPDYWLDNGGLRQPKREIGNFVAEAGFQVPERYDSISEALSAAQGGAVAVRSEHPGEYNGPSGLLHTSVLNTRYAGEFAGLLASGIGPDEVLLKARKLAMGNARLRRHLALTGTDAAKFEDELSYSFWEYIHGRNVTVVADDTVENRYHLFSIGGVSEDDYRLPMGSAYVTNEVGQASKEYEQAAQLSEKERQQLIEHYEAVRILPAFSRFQCPIMEWQIDADGSLWFLQYHKSRPFQPTSNQLDPRNYPSTEGWVRAEAVRGALGELVTLSTALWYPGAGEINTDLELPDWEGASFDLMYDPGLSEALSRKRVASLFAKSFPRVYELMANGHVERSRWFKPIASLALGEAGFKDVIPDSLYRSISDLVFQNGVMAKVVLDLASDGDRGYVRLNPDAEQPILA